MVDGLLANICIGIVPLTVPVRVACGTDSVPLGVLCAVVPGVAPK